MSEPSETDADIPGAVEVAPKPLIGGTFAVYEDGQGGFVLVTHTEEQGPRRQHIPSALVKMFTGGGLFARRFAGLLGVG